jgi:hypothetical protein
MGKFTVLAVDSFAGEVRGIDKIECYGIHEAFCEAGKLAANRTGVIILDEHDGVWFEFRQPQITKMTGEQRLRYRHYSIEAAASLYVPHPGHNCPTCDSPAPHQHPAMALEGEVETCVDDYHLIPTNQNRQSFIDGVLAKRALAA